MEEDREMEQTQTEQMDPVEIEGREQEEGKEIRQVRGRRGRGRG